MHTFTTKLSPTQCRDAGLALVFILLLLEAFEVPGPFHSWTGLAAVLVLLLMTVPKIFKPFGVLWFGLSTVLGAIMSRVIISLLFFIIVTPISLARRLAGADSLKLKQWKADSRSAFTVRNQLVTPADMENLF